MEVPEGVASLSRASFAERNYWTHWGRKKNSRHVADDIFKCIFLNENIWILVSILLKFVPKGQINNIYIYSIL